MNENTYLVLEVLEAPHLLYLWNRFFDIVWAEENIQYVIVPKSEMLCQWNCSRIEDPAEFL